MIKTFALQSDVLAPCIYRAYKHSTTPVGLFVGAGVRQELAIMLGRFLARTGTNPQSFLRVDAFIADGRMTVIEINVELQDGWGVSLNLLRAAGQQPGSYTCGKFPDEIIVYNDDYRPEFELARAELAVLGHELRLVHWRDRPGVRAKGEADDKIHLARFASTWRGDLVHIPPMFAGDEAPWSSLPNDVVFKFRDKHGNPARRCGYSVRRRQDVGNGRYVKKCYDNGTLVAQAYVEPPRTSGGSAVQAIIMCAGSTPMVGYAQVAPPDVFVINDKSASKGPLVMD